MRKKFINLTAFLALILLAVWGCVKDAKIDTVQENGDIEKVAAWYQRQLIPTNVKEAFANVNSPNWSATKVEKRGDSTFFTTLLLRDSIITRELQVTLHDGAYEGVVRQYQFKSTDSLFAGTFTVNGRLIDLGVYNKEGRYKLLGIAGNRNIVLMGIEDIDGGDLPIVDVYPPSNPSFPPSWPTYPPPPPPSYPPTYPPSGGGGGGGGGSSSSSNSSTWNNDYSTLWPGDISCASFKFQKPKTTSNVQSTRLTNIQPVTFNDLALNKVFSFPIGNLIIDVPAKYYDNSTIPAQLAAEKAAAAMNQAVYMMGELWGASGKYKAFNAEANYERELITLFSNYLNSELPGSRVTKDTGARPEVTSNSSASYKGFFDGLFGGC
ncbi:hypothetical protein [Sphingobacterium siyangense]|uniref:hypothetical protein n=1 Tax=Sphingobacterium siyangense TaxID=459529 RepID=UPI00301AA0AA